MRPRPQPDWQAIHEQLQHHRHLTLPLLWQEYKLTPMVLRQEHQAGEWRGRPSPVYDASTSEAWPASWFVAVLGASSYTYEEATCDQQFEAWIQAHIHALEFFGGVLTLVVPDNTHGRHPCLPLRSRSESHVARVRGALRDGRGASASLQAKR